MTDTFKQFVELIPNPSLNDQHRAFITEIESLVRKIYEETANLPEFSATIDGLVYRFFNLSDEEIKLIESKADLIRE